MRARLPILNLLLLLSLLLIPHAPAQDTPAAPAPRRPNIVFAFADDYGRYASAYASHDRTPGANALIRTPHIDAVASAGTLFLNAHVNSPSCTPCRGALLSGRHFWQTGRSAILSGAVWDPSIPSFPLLLRDAGYHIGKSHKVWSPGTPADAPFGGQQYAYEQAGNAINQFSQNVARLMNNGMSANEAKNQILTQVRKNFASFLDARPANAPPFCYWFGPTNTHRAWLRGSGKTQWQINPDSLQGRLPTFLPDVPEIREDFADYLGECLAFDAAVGVLIDELKQRNEWNQTLFAVSGDHGAPGFTHGKCNLYDFGTAVTLAIKGPDIPANRVIHDFTSLPSLAPTFLEAAHLPIPQGMSAPSLMPLLRSSQAGQIDPARDHVLTGRERHVDNARTGKLPYPMRAIRTASHLLILNFEPDRPPTGDLIPPTRGPQQATLAEIDRDSRAAFPDMDAGPTKSWLFRHRNDPAWQSAVDLAFGKRPPEELYQIASDPHQVHNLATDPTHAAIKSELRAKLLLLLQQSHDPRVTGDGRTYDRPPFAGNPPPP